jgi:hypothetical protein
MLPFSDTSYYQYMVYEIMHTKGMIIFTLVSRVSRECIQIHKCKNLDYFRLVVDWLGKCNLVVIWPGVLFFLLPHFIIFTGLNILQWLVLFWCAAVTATGVIWSRYSTVITPVFGLLNWFFSCCIFASFYFVNCYKNSNIIYLWRTHCFSDLLNFID